jgi:hypothetical protein
VSGGAPQAKRRFSLESARALLPEIRERTARAREEIDAIDEAQAAASGSADRAAELDQRKASTLSHWVRSMEALGVEVKGPWLVDFDNGEGYYCWRDPEIRLEYFHGYDEGFAGRVRIQ